MKFSYLLIYCCIISLTLISIFFIHSSPTNTISSIDQSDFTSIKPISFGNQTQSESFTVFLEPVSDATINSLTPDINFGNLNYNLTVQYLSSRQIQRFLLRFNIASEIPYEAVIDEAILYLYLDHNIGPDSIVLSAQCIKEDWIETQVTWTNQPSTDMPTTATYIITDPGYKDMNITPIVQSWHQVPHFGVELIGPEEETTYTISFHNRQQTGKTPQLEITYHLNNETQPSQGWCCVEGEIINATQEECYEMEGIFFETFEEAENECQETPPTHEHDISITNIWYEEDTIFYEITNHGDDIIQQNLTVALYIDNDLIITEQLTETIEPYQPLIHFFAYSWQCTQEGQHIRILADAENIINEYNEENNQIEEYWLCEQQELELISGPTILDVAQTSAIISWETNIPCDSFIFYGTMINDYDHEMIDTTKTTYHEFHLVDLLPSSIYSYTIKSTTESGQHIEAANHFFETPAYADDTPPQVTIQSPNIIKGLRIITADATDDHGVSRVEFYLNDTLLITDYSPPYQFTFDSKNYDNGMHDLRGKAYDTSNNIGYDDLQTNIANYQDKTAPQVKITSPSSSQTVSGSLDIHITASDDTALLYGQFMVDGNWSGNWYPSKEGVKKENFTFPWHTTQYTNGKHRIAFEIYDTDFKNGIGYQDVYVNNEPPKKPPDLYIISRTIKQTGNFYTITLTVKNFGETAAQKIQILDAHQLFQPISKDSTDAEYKSAFKPELTSWEVTIKSKVSIQPGKQQQYSYSVVPVLIPSVSIQPIKGGKSISALPPTNLLPIIGGTKYVNCTDIWFEPPDGSEIYYKRFPLSSIEFVSYHSALTHADYLIITSPRNLLKFNPENDVNLLLSSMAELAQLKNGVLGFIDPAAQFSLDFERHDAFVSENILGRSHAEIIIGDKSKDRIVIYSVEDKNLQYVSGSTIAPFHMNWWVETKFKCGLNKEGFDDGDRIAVGQVGTLPNSSIVMADCSAGAIITYDGMGFEKSKFFIKFDSFDGLGIGDVNNDGKGEIVIANAASNTISFYKPDGISLGKFSVSYNSGDEVVVGDVIGDNKEEVIIADDTNDKIYLYTDTGKLITWFYYIFDKGDGLAVGNMIATWPLDKEEIIIGDPRGNDVSILRGDGWEMDWFTRDFAPYDGFSVGDFNGCGICDVVTADQSQNFIEIHGLDQTTGNKYILQNLIKKYGSWSSSLKKNWTSNGYLLIVGETEIIPAWAGKNHGSVTTNMGKKALQAAVTDYPYASTIGKEIIPELAIGRIIGNSAHDLRIPIETSINVAKNTNGYGYAHKNYFAVSGFPRGLSGGSGNIDFKKELAKVTQFMHANNIYGVVMFTPDYVKKDASGNINQKASADTIANTFFAHTPNRDIIFLTGHGSSNSWDAIGFYNVLLQNKPFGNTNPVIYAASCTTGSYHEGISFAESMLMEGAGVYYGATQWGLDTHSWIHQRFFKYWKTGFSIGDVDRGIKQSIADSHYGSYSYPNKKARYYSSIYHVFGDPKYGLKKGTTSASSAIKVLFSNSEESKESDVESVTSLDLEVPSYETETYEDQSYKVIPGGDLLMVENQPIVPFYRFTYDVPHTHHIQDVRLISTSDVKTESNVVLPIVTETIRGEESEDVSSKQEEPFEWWPPIFYDWSIYENIDNSTLALTIYPYIYNSDTGEATYTSSFNFDIDYIVSSIEITHVQPDKHVYESGEPITIDIELKNSYTLGKDIIISASIIKESSQEITSKIPFTLLTDIKQNSTFSSTINSTDFSRGYYEVLVEIRDHNGTILDQNYAYFKIGSTRIITNNFTAQPQKSASGKIIDISFLFENIGSENITGITTFYAKNAADEIVYQMNINIENVSPSDVRIVSTSWDTSNLDEGTYQLHANVLYDGTSTSLKTLEIILREKEGIKDITIPIAIITSGMILLFSFVLYSLRKSKKE